MVLSKVGHSVWLLACAVALKDLALRENPVPTGSNSLRDCLFVPLQLTRLGVYCAGAKHEIRPDYTKGTPHSIESYRFNQSDKVVSVAYILAPNYDGFFRYDGVIDYNPYLLPSELSSFVVLAFDPAGTAFVGSVENAHEAEAPMEVELHLLQNAAVLPEMIDQLR